MDRQGFRTFLQSYKLNEEQVEESIAIADRFMAYVQEPGRTPSADTAWVFSKLLIEEGNNTEDNYIALIRYCRFIKNNEMFVALLELVDGGEVDENLYLASRNLVNVLVVEPRYADPVSLVHYKKVLVTKAAMDQLKEMFA